MPFYPTGPLQGLRDMPWATLRIPAPPPPDPNAAAYRAYLATLTAATSAARAAYHDADLYRADTLTGPAAAELRRQAHWAATVGAP